jgi:hypothetical protein
LDIGNGVKGRSCVAGVFNLLKRWLPKFGIADFSLAINFIVQQKFVDVYGLLSTA